MDTSYRDEQHGQCAERKSALHLYVLPQKGDLLVQTVSQGTGPIAKIAMHAGLPDFQLVHFTRRQVYGLHATVKLQASYLPAASDCTTALADCGVSPGQNARTGPANSVEELTETASRFWNSIACIASA